jgi:hypothetical protein
MSGSVSSFLRDSQLQGELLSAVMSVQSATHMANCTNSGRC